MYMSFNCLYSITTDPRVLAVGLEVKIKVLYCFSLTQVSVILYNFYYCNVIAWPTFYDPMILPYILNTVRWIGIILGIIVQYVIKIYHILPDGQPDLYLSPPIKGEVAILFLVRILLASVLSSAQFLVCTISHEPVEGFLPNLHGFNIGTRRTAD